MLEAIYDVNQRLENDKKIEVVAVSNPSLWPMVNTSEDYLAFRSSLSGRDYYMYDAILNKMKRFKEGRKGIFLTNTRHAYTNIKKKNGSFYWNTGTIFRSMHPDKNVLN